MKHFITYAIIIFSLASCQTSKHKQAEQQIIPEGSEEELASYLTKRLEAKYRSWKAPIVQEIVLQVADQLTGSRKSTRLVLLSTDEPLMAAGLHQTVYLSKGLLKQPQYENELAFLVAMQIAHLQRRSPQQRLTEGNSQNILDSNWFNTGGLFDVGTEAQLQVLRQAVRLMHSAHFDPRGAVTLIQKWNLKDKTKENAEILPDHEEMLKTARDEVAKLSPLRDPVVRSDAFERLQVELKGKTKVK